jgi:hypothetical protein
VVGLQACTTMPSFKIFKDYRKNMFFPSFRQLFLNAVPLYWSFDKYRKAIVLRFYSLIKWVWGRPYRLSRKWGNNHFYIYSLWNFEHSISLFCLVSLSTWYSLRCQEDTFEELLRPKSSDPPQHTDSHLPSVARNPGWRINFTNTLYLLSIHYWVSTVNIKYIVGNDKVCGWYFNH